MDGKFDPYKFSKQSNSTNNKDNTAKPTTPFDGLWNLSKEDEDEEEEEKTMYLEKKVKGQPSTAERKSELIHGNLDVDLLADNNEFISARRLQDDLDMIK
jgi:hypothetical protein